MATRKRAKKEVFVPMAWKKTEEPAAKRKPTKKAAPWEKGMAATAEKMLATAAAKSGPKPAQTWKKVAQKIIKKVEEKKANTGMVISDDEWEEVAVEQNFVYGPRFCPDDSDQD